MKFVVFDTEDTGVGRKDEVIQIGGILLDEKLNMLRPFNEYFLSSVPVHKDAAAVTGLGSKQSQLLGRDRYFEDFYWENQDLFSEDDITWCAYNASYDIRMVNQTLQNNGIAPYNFGTQTTNLFDATTGHHYFDVMLSCKNGLGLKYFPKLAACEAHTKYTPSALAEMYNKIMKIIDSINPSYDGVPFSEYVVSVMNVRNGSLFHDALYDAMVTWLLMYQNRKWCL